MIVIFNRSHYEDVLIVRVHELVSKKVWKERYELINDFEKMLVQNKILLLKFFLHISKSEQRSRLEQRLKDPTRYWKLSLDDVEERRYWSDYRKAYEDALERCSTKWAPWHIVPANKKWYRNLVVARTVVETLRSGASGSCPTNLPSTPRSLPGNCGRPCRKSGRDGGGFCS
jgi:polyphosphate kinase 2 (PPK2 family)